jgi:PEP-CTERM motif
MEQGSVLMKFPLKATVAALSLLAAAPASAALVSAGVDCDITRTNPDADACSGYWAGNLNNNASEDDLNLALDDLMGGSFDPDVVFVDIEDTKDFFTELGGTLTFDDPLMGQQILSLHFGNAGNEFGGDVTVLYLFTFDEPTSSIELGQDGFSNAVLIGGGVPEPSTWAMMMLGFGAVGYGLRRRRREGLLAQVA